MKKSLPLPEIHAGGVFLIWDLTSEWVVKYGAVEQETMGNKEISWEDLLPFVNMMLQGLITNMIEL